MKLVMIVKYFLKRIRIFIITKKTLQLKIKFDTGSIIERFIGVSQESQVAASGL